MGFKTAPLKRSFKIVSGSTPASDTSAYWDGPVTWVTPVDLSGGAKTISGSARTLSNAGYEACGTTKVPAGSLILSTRAPIGSIAIAAAELCTNQGCKALVPVTGLDSRYFYYQLSVKAIELNSLGRGSTFLELSTAALGDFELYTPPLATQTAIAEYLDRKTAAIDALIAKKELLIEELRKYQEAVIAEELAAYGSGARIRLKFVADVLPGQSPAGEEVTLDGVTPFIQGCAEFGTDYPEPTNFCETAARLAKPGDIILSVRAPVGRLNTASTPIGLGRGVAAVRAKPGICARYVYWSLFAERATLCAAATGTTFEAVTAPDIENLAVPKLSQLDQEIIACSLDKKCRAMQSAAQKAVQTIASLKTYRAALISEAVTGKISV